MPIYDYLCGACEHEFTFTKIKSDEKLPTNCPKCESDKIQKQISKKTRFILKGKGWYKDGYSK